MFLNSIHLQAFTNVWYLLLLFFSFYLLLARIAGVPSHLIPPKSTQDLHAEKEEKNNAHLLAHLQYRLEQNANTPDGIKLLFASVFSFVLAFLSVLGLGYGWPLGQALLLLLLPFVLVKGITFCHLHKLEEAISHHTDVVAILRRLWILTALSIWGCSVLLSMAFLFF